MSMTKSVFLNWYYEIEKKIRKIQLVFYIENQHGKSDCGTVWHFDPMFIDYNNFHWAHTGYDQNDIPKKFEGKSSNGFHMK